MVNNTEYHPFYCLRRLFLHILLCQLSQLESCKAISRKLIVRQQSHITHYTRVVIQPASITFLHFRNGKIGLGKSGIENAIPHFTKRIYVVSTEDSKLRSQRFWKYLDKDYVSQFVVTLTLKMLLSRQDHF